MGSENMGHFPPREKNTTPGKVVVEQSRMPEPRMRGVRNQSVKLF